MNAYTWDELLVGVSADFSVTITEEMLVRFSKDTGDCNPLHVDAAFATAAGFADRVVYGLLTASFFSTLAGVYLPGKNGLLHGLNVAFHEPVYVGDHLRVRGEVTYRNESYRQAEVACRSTNQHNAVVAAGKLKVGFTTSG